MEIQILDSLDHPHIIRSVVVTNIPPNLKISIY